MTTIAKPGRWRSLSRGRKALVILLGIVLLLALGAWIASLALRPRYRTPEQITAQYKAQAALTGGAKVYATHCAYCHNKGFGPSIAGRNLPSEAIASFVRNGPGAMPAFPSSQVSDADIAAVTRYVNGLSAKPPEDVGK